MAYTPPDPTSVNGQFSESYTPPAKNAVNGNITSGGTPQTVFVDGFEATELGDTVARWNQYPAIQGLDSLEWGDNRTFNYAYVVGDFTLAYVAPDPSPLNIDFAAIYGQLTPYGTDHLAVGSPSIAFDAAFLLPSGVHSLEFSDPVVGGRKYVYTTGLSQLSFGLPQDVDYEIRYRYFVGLDTLAIGTHVIGTRQYVYPLGNTHTVFGVPTYGYHASYDIQGFDSLLVGAPVIDYVRVLPSGFDTLGIDEPVVRNQKQTVYPFGFSSFVEASYRVYNLREYVLPPSLINAEGVDGSTAYYGQSWTITGPDGPIAPLGLEYLRFGYTSIFNTASAIQPAGLAPPDVPEHAITHWVQYAYPTGVDTFQGPSLLLQIRNAALAAQPSGWDSLSAINIADIKDARQTALVFHPGDFTEHTEWGADTFIAYRIRTLTIYSPPSWPVPFPQPTISLNKFLFDGIDSLRTGLPYIEIHFNIIAPSGIAPPDMLLAHDVRNRNRSLPLLGEVQTVYGQPFVWTNKLEVPGADHLSFSLNTIADRTRYVAPAAWASLRADPFLVRHDPEPPVTQVVYAAGIDSFEEGNQEISNNTILCAGIASLAFGSAHEIIVMGVTTQGWIDSDQDGNGFGTPVCVFDQIVQMEGIDNETALQVSEPTLWPYYITAPDPLRPVDWEVIPPTGPGYPAIDFYHRYLYPGFLATTIIGTPTIELRDRVVYPSGLAAFKYGVPAMGGGISSYGAALGVVQTQYGEHTISHVVPYSPYVSPAGASMTEFGATEIMLFHRQVYPLGMDTMQMGYPFGPSSGVFFTPLAYDVQGFEGTVWGADTFIAHRNRAVYMNGFESFNQRPTIPFQSRFTKNPPGTAPVHALR